jgi:hypothetical protein
MISLPIDLTACPLLCWFLDAGNKEDPHAQLAGVQKAPRHEVAESWAPAGQRATGFGWPV